ncbi:hypothetical protein D3C72_2193620 [compost metagenome]
MQCIVVEGLVTVLDLVDTRIQILVLPRQPGKVRIALQQAAHGVLELREFTVERVMF